MYSNFPKKRLILEILASWMRRLCALRRERISAKGEDGQERVQLKESGVHGSAGEWSSNVTET